MTKGNQARSVLSDNICGLCVHIYVRYCMCTQGIVCDKIYSNHVMELHF